MSNIACESVLAGVDPEVAQVLASEAERQANTIELIASENYVSQAVMEAQGSVLTNKYAEGYPGHRWYGGCRHVDAVEQIAINRAKALFGAEHANVQPHSGSQANAAAYMAVLQGGDTVLGMSKAHGGHLTHGDHLSFSGQMYHFVQYGVSRETERIDYDEVELLAKRHQPKLIVAGASAYPRIIDFPRLRAIADQVGALLMVDIAHIAGLVVAGVPPSPVPYAQLVTTTNHKTMRGPRGGMILCSKDLAKKVDRAVFPGIQGGPLEHVISAKAVALKEAMLPEFQEYGRRIVANAAAMADELMKLGVRLVSGGTDNHLMLLDLTSLGVTGDVAEERLEQAGLAANKNMIPFDPQPPLKTSGIRLGTPAITTRGFREAESRRIAQLVVRVLQNVKDDAVIAQVRAETLDLCRAFPIPR